MPTLNEFNDPIPFSGVASGTCTAGRAAKASASAAEAEKYVNCSTAGEKPVGIFTKGGASGDAVGVATMGRLPGAGASPGNAGPGLPCCCEAIRCRRAAMLVHEALSRYR